MAKMTLEIDIPEGATVEVDKDNGRVYITFDTNKTRTSCWQATFATWLTEGGKNEGSSLSSKIIEVSNRNKLSMRT